MDFEKEIQEEWRILPRKAPAVWRNCPGCKRKREYESSRNFRVNANGSRLDVWLIYRCPVCSSSWNLSIYERIPARSIPEKLYQSFLKNDGETALKMACSSRILAENRAEAVWETAEYEVEKRNEGEDGRRSILLWNEAGLPIRYDRLLRRELGLSTREFKKLYEEGKIQLPCDVTPKSRIAETGKEPARLSVQGMEMHQKAGDVTVIDKK